MCFTHSGRSCISHHDVLRSHKKTMESFVVVLLKRKESHRVMVQVGVFSTVTITWPRATTCLTFCLQSRPPCSIILKQMIADVQVVFEKQCTPKMVRFEHATAATGPWVALGDNQMLSNNSKHMFRLGRAKTVQKFLKITFIGHAQEQSTTTTSCEYDLQGIVQHQLDCCTRAQPAPGFESARQISPLANAHHVCTQLWPISSSRWLSFLRTMRQVQLPLSQSACTQV
jgi:hypothetical protein